MQNIQFRQQQQQPKKKKQFECGFNMVYFYRFILLKKKLKKITAIPKKIKF
jgi:hypothetical protein